MTKSSEDDDFYDHCHDDDESNDPLKVTADFLVRETFVHVSSLDICPFFIMYKLSKH